MHACGSTYAKVQKQGRQRTVKEVSHSTILVLGNKQAVRLHKCIYPLNHLAAPIFWFFKIPTLKCYRSKVDNDTSCQSVYAWTSRSHVVLTPHTQTQHCTISGHAKSSHLQENCPRGHSVHRTMESTLCLANTASVCWAPTAELYEINTQYKGLRRTWNLRSHQFLCHQLHCKYFAKLP